MIRLNVLGAIFLFGSALVANIVRYFMADDSPIIAFAVMGVLMSLGDLAYRSRQSGAEAKKIYFLPLYGGQFVFLPCWLWGIFLMVTSALMELGYTSIPS